ncbi:polypeptide N-acetylgalactosaminyltransferase 2-like [Mya arenaria]|uniref:polypeptide N-acetylgalactosaminyltransferase 2-like n=1 Tax=Mya arenaria TaxID=6604 RepID=UPI0022DE9C48|nr:polypeptide N-acetylgalactosaminyltransferase 2-like [Mya arenaria]XP_052769861.1 polypeptide N-acetylgalactosaminyltransferase 2-like [Mya arenaria]
MHWRKKRKLFLWIFLLTVAVCGVWTVNFVRNYLAVRELVADLKTGEYLSDLGRFSVDDFLMKLEPDVSSLTSDSFPNISIPLGRQLPDTRPARCSPNPVQLVRLPDTSVVTVVQGEPRHVILRTIYTVLLRTPPDLLKEIIVVDDGSEDVSAGQQLMYIPKVKVIRTDKQQGLIQSYNLAAGIAEGKVLTFISVKCEVNVGWLEPMLQRLVQKPAAVVSPVLDSISHTGEYLATADALKGVFDWGLMTSWEKLERLPELDTVVRTIVYRGQVFCVGRERFRQLGRLDPGFDGQGGENIELSLKAWLCGGSVERVLCSRVGQVHLDKELTGIQKGRENIYTRNVKRVAEVWLDDYKRFFYHIKPSARMVSVDSVAERRSLRKQLRCKTFKWFLENVYPELLPPVTDEVMYGNLRQGNQCVDIEVGHVPTISKLAPCDPHTGSQDWSLKQSGEVISGGMCLTADPVETHGYVMVHFCTGLKSQKWELVEGQLARQDSGLCLDSHKAEVGLVISECDGDLPSQKWSVSSKQAKSRSRDEV